MDISLASSQKGSLLCILGSFFKVKVQKGDIFWVAKISNIFWGT